MTVIRQVSSVAKSQHKANSAKTATTASAASRKTAKPKKTPEEMAAIRKEAQVKRKATMAANKAAKALAVVRPLQSAPNIPVPQM